MKKHKFQFTNESVKRIDWFLPKLKYSILPSKMVSWFENFEEKDLNLIYDLLQVFEYISFDEFQYRVEEQLELIVNELSIDEKILVIPFGKFGKSGTLVTYPLTHSPFYEKMYRSGRIYLSNDYQKYTTSSIDCVILLDDFIGSGKTFCEEYEKNGIREWIEEKGIEKRYILSAVIMQHGKLNIENKYPDIEIFAQERRKIFNKIQSSLKMLGDLGTYESISAKYEREMKINDKYKGGYENSQSLIAFTHSTPNNTLPIFWWGKGWTPLFPRHAEIRMDQAKEFKKEVSFYIGICNRLGIDLFDLDNRIMVKNQNGAMERQRKYNTQIHHSIIALIKLKLKEAEDYIIGQILGLTDAELNEVYTESIEMGYIDSSRSLTAKGSAYIIKLEKTIRKEKFRKASEQNLKIKDIIYVPLSFKGMT